MRFRWRSIQPVTTHDEHSPVPGFKVFLAVLLAGLMPLQGNAAVGRLSGSPGVGPSGAATYAIPIEVAGGMNGLKPSIALVYSSQSGGYLAGAGWSLAGFSAITRCGHSTALDTRVRGVTFSTEDRFCLDGTPLIMLTSSGTYGGNDVEYRTEIHSYQRIVSKGGGSSGPPETFEVQQPNGLTYIYGGGTATVLASGITPSVVRVWALHVIKDKFGNQINFDYATPVAGEYVPDEVTWTATGTGGPYKLKFNYTDLTSTTDSDALATAVRSGYVWGAAWQATRRLKSIDYTYSGTRVHLYTLHYTTTAGSTGKSRLDSVTQCGPGSSPACLPATAIAWQDGTTAFGASSQAGPPATTAYAQSVFGDINGDGGTDVYMQLGGNWKYVLVEPIAGDFDVTAGYPVNLSWPVYGTSGGHRLDFDGDGRTDLMAEGSDGDWHVRVVNTSLCTSGDCDTGIAVSANPKVVPLDVNGDGLSDLVSARSDGHAYIYINTGTAYGGALSTSPALGVSLYRNLRGVTDVDGDGREDLISSSRVGPLPAGPSAYYTQILVSRSYWNGTNDALTTEEQIAYIADTGNPVSNITVADINGDGLSDVAYQQGGYWGLLLSKGNSFAQPYSTSVSTATGTFGDINDDGRDDLVAPCASGSSWCAYLSTGTSLSNTATTLGGPNPSTVAAPHLVDLNGDGTLEFMPVLNTSGNPWQVWSHQGGQPDLVTGITDGLGNSFAPSYKSLTAAIASGTGYSTTGSGNPPTTRLIRGGPMSVVRTATVSTGIGSGTYTTTYGYATGLQDTTGRGFQGFKTVTATDSRNGLVTTTDYLQAFPFTGRPDLVTVKNGSNTVSEYKPTWTEQLVSGVAPPGISDSNHIAGRYHFVHLDHEVQKTYEVDGGGSYNGSLMLTVTHETRPSGTAWNYTHGAPNAEKVTAVPAVGETLTTITERTFYDLTSAWCLGLPSAVDITRSDGTSSSTRKQSFTYYSNCRPDTEYLGETTAKQLRTKKTYYDTGQLHTLTQDSADNAAPDRLMTVTYNGSTGTGFRPVSEAFTAGGVDHAVGHAWNEGLGLETGRSNPQGESTGWAYDTFGRLETETRPVGSSTFTYTACGTCLSSNAKYKVRETRSDAFWSESHRDALGREVGKASILNDGSTESRQVFTYNDLGRRVTETVPYRSDQSPYSITRTYDLMGRPKSESRQISEVDTGTQTTTWLYNRQSTTVTDAENHARTFSVDVEGNLVTAQEPSPGGTTTYGYTPWGELNAVTDASGHQTTNMSYDERGFRTGVVDQDAGTSTAEYTVWGELYRFRDARTGSSDWTLTNTFDQLGRLTTRVDYDPVAATSATTTWEFYTTTDTSTDARKGLLYRARSYVGNTSSTIAYEQVNTYDIVAGTQVSPLQTVTKIDGAPQSSYTTSYEYDSQGRLEHMTYPSTVTGGPPRFDYTYSYGYLDTVKQYQGTTYDRYDLVTMDALGRETLARLGTTALDVQTVYDRVNLLVKEIKSGTPSLGTGTQNLAYTWDKVGNLTTRQDKNQSGTPTYLTEVFTYDALNRLDVVTRNGTVTQNMGYGPDGNISTKTMPDGYLTSYNYATSGKPHAVSSTSYSYDCNCSNCGGGCSSCTNTTSYGYDAAGNLLTRSGYAGNRWLTWTAFSKPKQISIGTSGCAGDCTTFTYGPDRQLVKQVDKKGGTTRTVYYVGPHFEVEVVGAVTEYRSHALANGRVVFTQVEDTGGGVSWQAYYPLRDHLGSVDKQYAAMGGGPSPLVYSYDAYGRRRNGDWTNDGAGSQMTPTLWNRRGYTDHEMLDTAQFVHMKGRVYDPTLGRFLSPDPVLGQLGSPQSLNPYSYVGNNPLSATDPSGYSAASVMADSFWATSVDMIANGALSDLNVAIASYTSQLNGWVNACKASAAACGGGDFPMPTGVTSAAQGAVAASTLALNMITNGLLSREQQQAVLDEAKWEEMEALADEYRETKADREAGLGDKFSRERRGGFPIGQGMSLMADLKFTAASDSPYYARGEFVLRFAGSSEEAAVEALLDAAIGGLPPYKNVRGDYLNLPGGSKAEYKYYIVPGPEPKPPGRLAWREGTNTFYFGPNHGDRMTDVPSGWIEITVAP